MAYLTITIQSCDECHKVVDSLPGRRTITRVDKLGLSKVIRSEKLCKECTDNLDDHQIHTKGNRTHMKEKFKFTNKNDSTKMERI
jgi:hypothetical protein